MANGGQELHVQQKREVKKKQESTVPARVYVPVTDIFEADQALMVVLEMPGVERESVNVTLDDGTLTIEGQINLAKYDGLHPVYTEYNVGNCAQLRSLERHRPGGHQCRAQRRRGHADVTESREGEAAQDPGELGLASTAMRPIVHSRHPAALRLGRSKSIFL
jgi:hypothetical protein